VQQALEQCEEFVSGQMRDRQVQGLIMCKLAQLRAMNGEFEKARTMYRQARAMLDDLGRTVNVSTTSFDLGMIELWRTIRPRRSARCERTTTHSCNSARPT
jgi:hypothetical protein